MASKQLIKKNAAAGQDGIKDPLIDAEEGLTEPFGDEPAPKSSRYTRKFWIVAAILAAVACAAVVAVGGAAFYLLRPPPPPRSLFDAEHSDLAPPRKMVALVNKPPVDAELLPELSAVDTVSPKAESMAAAAPSPDAEPKVAVALFEELPNVADVAVVPTTVAAVAGLDVGATTSKNEGGRQESQGTAVAASALGEASLWDDYFFGGDDEYQSYASEGDDEDDALYQDGDDYFDLYQDDTAVEFDQSSSPTEQNDDDSILPVKPAGIYDYSDDDDEPLVESNEGPQIEDGDSEWIFEDLDGYDYAAEGQEERVRAEDVDEEEQDQQQQSWSDRGAASADYTDPIFDDTDAYFRGDDSYAAAEEDDAGDSVPDVSDLFDVIYEQEDSGYGGGEDVLPEEDAVAVEDTYYDDAERLLAADPAAYEEQSQAEADDLF